MTSSDTIIGYFGYGSLVNRATLRTEIVDAVPARLRGWRRCWRPRPDMPGFPAALLSVREDEASAVDGLLVFDRAENLAAVDAREARYNRHAVPAGAIETSGPLPAGCPLYVYVAQQDIPLHAGVSPILQSYLDAVLQGFLVEHGEEAVARFIAETDGFDRPILADRAAPIYPRAVRLSEGESTFFDRLLAEIGAKYTVLSHDCL